MIASGTVFTGATVVPKVGIVVFYFLACVSHSSDGTGRRISHDGVPIVLQFVLAQF